MVKRFKSKTGEKLLLESYDNLLKLWGVHIEEKDVDTRYGKTHIILVGDTAKHPLLLFHGVGDNSALMWIYNARELSGHFYIIAVDTMGGPGKSEPGENYNKSFDHVLWIDDILDILYIDRLSIAGVSNGAWLAQCYTAKRPDRVNRVVCMAGSVSVQSKSNTLLKMMKVFLPEALFPTQKNIHRLIKKLCGPNHKAFTGNDKLMQHWFYLLKYFNTMSMAFHKVFPLNQQEIDILREKALFLIGNFDRLVFNDRAIDALKENNLKFKIINDAGHGINHEQPTEINKEIAAFISG
jgi:pimeloyl-ACP methyl ester carboxylesterase